ncbi:dihydroxyacetone kinase subunit DhaK [Staphylococcus hominis]|uniref:dihydroxyacetone kinase subunit DhaK n=1 Tax=Staphylococcus hominis TaxID=1290 RepID=UPI000C7CEFDB|nr:dihydroxyacetone kinase subunit DhaK [Staphylococcus hominis]MCI2894512.1 dihydroxyacetone kinase subunit DhaK [Staphylococcus hominis]MCI2903167.1 dihydroxyacetone kinase subunit DhaK [Staphylococcus hominis]MCI2905432.1 dihydroxyacetone kinase subunit DhaK [Staphylococcus hominis]MCI2912026.1 dihydroxyacetone kinase subunit DhaK [Staphylococcus hominis]MCT1470555.1 dihydroxyacetone kinase subunit DhaK [Staphylococcus hominis]
MKKLIKEKNNILTDMLEGIALTNDNIEIISETVVVKKNKKNSGVALVSGGGSGHEPAHAGYVDNGMLDAAVCGEVFTSPTPDKILDAIKEVDTGDGVLLIVKNYAGDVMNFEMAQEMAQMEDIKVERVIVNDDIAVSDVEKRRGVAGTVFVHKYAGYLADQGLSLEDIKNKIESFIPKIKSIGMALTSPMVPTTGKYSFDIDDNEMEIGIGIHGEKGLHREAIQSVDVIIKRLLDELLKEVKDKSLIVMVNGMGGTPLSELNIVAKYLNQQFQEHDIAAKQWFVGDYMTSLDMQGFSITVVPYSEEIEKGLLAPTTSRYF